MNARSIKHIEASRASRPDWSSMRHTYNSHNLFKNNHFWGTYIHTEIDDIPSCEETTLFCQTRAVIQTFVKFLRAFCFSALHNIDEFLKKFCFRVAIYWKNCPKIGKLVFTMPKHSSCWKNHFTTVCLTTLIQSHVACNWKTCLSSPRHLGITYSTGDWQCERSRESKHKSKLFSWKEPH